MEPSSDVQFLAQILSKLIGNGVISVPEADRLELIAIRGHSSVPANHSTGEAPS